MKADLAIYTHVLGVPGQYESVALMFNHKIDFNCCANRDSFCNPVTYYIYIRNKQHTYDCTQSYVLGGPTLKPSS